MNVFKRGILIMALLAASGSAAASEEPQPSFGRWAAAQCRAGASCVGGVCSRAAATASLANRRRLEEFARDAYFSIVEFEETLVDKRVGEASPLAGENAEFYFDRGRVRAKRGEYDAAIEDFNACLRLAPDKAAAYFARACVWGEKKEYYRGIRDLDRCIRVEPRFAAAYRVRGAYWLTLDEADQALADFDVFVRLDGSGPAYLCRALAWIRKSEPARASSDLEQTARLRPNDAASCYILGCVRLWMGDDEGAVAAFDQALKLAPEMAVAYFGRAIAWQRRGKSDLASADLARAAELDPEKTRKTTPPARGCTVRVEVRATGADDFSYRLTWKRPVAGKASARRGYRGDSAANEHRAAQLRGYYEGLDPATRERANTLNELAWHWATARYEKLRDGVRAVEAAREACELTHWKDAACLDTLAAAYAECGDFESADKFQTLALELWPAVLDGRPQGERRLARYRQRQPLEPEDTYTGSRRSAAANASRQPAQDERAGGQAHEQADVDWGAFKATVPAKQRFDAERFKPNVKHEMLASRPPQEDSAATSSSGADSPANAAAPALPDQSSQKKSTPISECPRVAAPWLEKDDFEVAQTRTSRAWLWATSRYAAGRDGVRAVEAAREACELTEWRASGCLEALAAAYAECGDFESADKFQTLAVERAADAASGDRGAAFRRLGRYRERRPIHQGAFHSSTRRYSP